MLREYQDEIKRLKDQLDATQRGVIIGEDGKVHPMCYFLMIQLPFLHDSPIVSMLTMMANITITHD